MNYYDIFHIEDDKDLREDLEIIFKKKGLTYFGVESLEELTANLNQDTRANVFIVDGRFPRVNGGYVERLGLEAINFIKNKYPSSIIYLLTGEDSNIIDDSSVKYVSKNAGNIRPFIQSIISEFD